jgi:hypothetical protein
MLSVWSGRFFGLELLEALECVAERINAKLRVEFRTFRAALIAAGSL